MLLSFLPIFVRPFVPFTYLFIYLLNQITCLFFYFYLPDYFSTYPSFLPTYLSFFLPSFHPFYLPIFLLSSLSTHLPIFLPSFLPFYLPTCSSARLPLPFLAPNSERDNNHAHHGLSYIPRVPYRPEIPCRHKSIASFVLSIWRLSRSPKNTKEKIIICKLFPRPVYNTWSSTFSISPYYLSFSSF